ncbi:IS5 family transposase [Paraburkholderia sp. RAU2J]|nr:IS5 family transposase [Paraburkholderia sp. RAU2J]
MGPKTAVSEGDLFRHPLREQINLKHPLVHLADLINWDGLNASMSASFVSHKRSAGHITEADCWFVVFPACVRSVGRGSGLAMGLGEAGVEELLATTIEAAKRAGVIKASSAKRLIVDTTFMQKAIAHPTDSRLLERCREHLVKAAARQELKLRQNHNREVPHLARQIGRYAHAKQYKRMKKALRTLRSRVARVMRDVERQLDSVADTGRIALQELIGRTRRILSHKQKDKNKLYALHAPEVDCLTKGKARTPYEFGVKVSITTTHKEGLVVGARSMPGNPYDGHTLAEALEQAAILSDVKPEVAIVDRGYKGLAIEGVKIYHPGLRRGITRQLRAMIRRRSAIEPAIGHMKTDGKLDRNWLKGALGDAIHAVLCGAGHNLRMILRKLRPFCILVLFALLNRSTTVVFKA